MRRKREMAQEQHHSSAAAWRFHNATKYVHSGSGRADDDSDILMGEAPHLIRAIGEQDRAIEPLPYKIYTTLEPNPLPREFPASELPALDALAANGDVQPQLDESHAVPDLNAVARLCLRSNGLLKRWRSPSGKEI